MVAQPAPEVSHDRRSVLPVGGTGSRAGDAQRAHALAQRVPIGVNGVLDGGSVTGGRRLLDFAQPRLGVLEVESCALILGHECDAQLLEG